MDAKLSQKSRSDALLFSLVQQPADTLIHHSLPYQLHQIEPQQYPEPDTITDWTVYKSLVQTIGLAQQPR